MTPKAVWLCCYPVPAGERRHLRILQACAVGRTCRPWSIANPYFKSTLPLAQNSFHASVGVLDARQITVPRSLKY